MDFYHDGMRELQDRYEGREVADRLEQHRMRATFNDNDRSLIETAPFFFLASAAGDNNPTGDAASFATRLASRGMSASRPWFPAAVSATKATPRPKRVWKQPRQGGAAPGMQFHGAGVEVDLRFQRP